METSRPRRAGPVQLRRQQLCLQCHRGGDEQSGELLRCDMCSRWCHVACSSSHGDGVAGSREDNEPNEAGEADEAAAADSLTCKSCAEGLAELRIAPAADGERGDGGRRPSEAPAGGVPQGGGPQGG